jgi:cell division septation protein DedD
MDSMGTMRDLDQIREREDGRDPARTLVLAVGGLAAACVLFAAGVLIGRDNEAPRNTRREDPLARLDALAAQSSRAPAPEVTYPSQLGERRAALEGANSVAPASPAAAGPSAPSTSVATPPSAVAGNAGPLAGTGPSAARAGANVPAGALVDNAGGVRALTPSARLPVAATQAQRVEANERTAPVGVGSEGAFTLQVSSFRNLSGAQTFAQRLRERGHHAYVASAPATTGTGTWHRVRIGPFPSMREVSRYRADFEARERLPTFVVRRDNNNEGAARH